MCDKYTVKHTLQKITTDQQGAIIDLKGCSVIRFENEGNTAVQLFFEGGPAFKTLPAVTGCATYGADDPCGLLVTNFKVTFTGAAGSCLIIRQYNKKCE